jgi:hypothetical protein
MDMAVARLADVVELQPQMIVGRYVERAGEIVLASQQRDEVARTGRGDGVVESRQRTDMDHRIIQPRIADAHLIANWIANSDCEIETCSIETCKIET